MKIAVIIILIGLILIPVLSWIIYGSMGEILPWFGLLGVIAGVVLFVNYKQGKKLW